MNSRPARLAGGSAPSGKGRPYTGTRSPRLRGRRVLDDYRWLSSHMMGASTSPSGRAPARVPSARRPGHQRRSAQFAQPAPVDRGNVPIVPSTANITGNGHRYVVFQFGPSQPGVISGISSYLNVSNPNPVPGAMSLSQQWILSGPLTSKGLPQSIESDGRFSPFSGTSVHVIRLLQPRWILTTNRDTYTVRRRRGDIPAQGASWVPGVALSQISALVAGTQFAFLMVWRRGTNGNWNLYWALPDSDLMTVGYFPKEYCSGGVASGADFHPVRW